MKYSWRSSPATLGKNLPDLVFKKKCDSRNQSKRSHKWAIDCGYRNSGMEGTPHMSYFNRRTQLTNDWNFYLQLSNSCCLILRVKRSLKTKFSHFNRLFFTSAYWQSLARWCICNLKYSRLREHSSRFLLELTQSHTQFVSVTVDFVHWDWTHGFFLQLQNVTLLCFSCGRF